MKLKDKFAIVTGASTGIGRAISLALGQEGVYHLPFGIVFLNRLNVWIAAEIEIVLLTTVTNVLLEED